MFYMTTDQNKAHYNGSDFYQQQYCSVFPEFVVRILNKALIRYQVYFSTASKYARTLNCNLTACSGIL